MQDKIFDVSEKEGELIRLELPYGAKYTDKGKKEYFNRGYMLLSNPSTHKVDGEVVRTEHYYYDGTPYSERKKIGEKVLSDPDYLPELTQEEGISLEEFNSKYKK